MSLASALLKRAYIAKATGIAWADIKFRRRGNAVHGTTPLSSNITTSTDIPIGKPCWDPPKYLPGNGSKWPQLDFNVSHQAGLATLVGVCVKGGDSNNEGEDEVLVGCDIVSPNERPDMAAINASDFEDYTSTYGAIFSQDELFDITYNVPSGAVTLLSGERLSSETLGRLDRTIVSDENLSVTLPNGRTEEFSSDLIIDAKLRQFYTFFCLKEAYIKLVGEGLLAPWIKDCEFRQVHPPTAGTAARCSTSGSWGGKVTGGRASIKAANAKYNNLTISPDDEEIEIWLHGEEIHDVITEVQAFEEV
jgi:4'-phosphopantetheinyl transferase